MTHTSTSEIIEGWLRARLSDDEYLWLHTQVGKVEKSNSDRELHITLGLIPRKLSREDLDLKAHELAQASQIAHGWQPVNWSVDITARAWVLSCLTSKGNQQFGELIVDLCRTADLAESIAIYSGLPIYPNSSALELQVAEGLRSNIKAVFESIAHNNPYPYQHFKEHRWNHMVLKALFIESKLSRIVGLDERANKELATTLTDYAHERWAAGRSVSYELWRCVGPYATDDQLFDLERVATTGNAIEKSAAMLALHSCATQDAELILKRWPDVRDKIHRGEITWNNLESSCVS
jgi:hypothetical protein